MRDWLRHEIGLTGGDIVEAYLFGSILDQQRLPRDIDLVVVTADGAAQLAWGRVRDWRESVALRFRAQFGLSLSILIATPSEWNEIDGTIVRRRESLI